LGFDGTKEELKVSFTANCKERGKGGRVYKKREGGKRSRN